MLKRWIRSLVPAHYWLSLSWWRVHYGFFNALRVHARLLMARDGLLKVQVDIDGCKLPVFLRPGTTDLDVFDEVFTEGEYDLDIGTPRRILDAGAHIGLATVVFAARFPHATVMALEPEPGNFAMLKRNTARLGNVIAVQAGLWSRTAHLCIANPEATTWAFRVIESGSNTGIPALSMADVIEQLGNEGPLALKIDIEGAEVEVLSSSAPWIAQVDTLIMELHDRFRPGCTQALEKAIANRDFVRSQSGESVVLRACATA